MLDRLGNECVDINVIKGQRKSIFNGIVEQLLRDDFKQIDLSKTK